MVNRVPIFEEPRKKKRSRIIIEDMNSTVLSSLTEDNSRPIYSCSSVKRRMDSDKIYFIERSAYPTASIELEKSEAISIPPASFIWMYDKSKNSIELIGKNFTSISSLLLENEESELNFSILLTESTRYNLLRIFPGNNSKTEELYSNFQGMPLSIQKDNESNIWILLGRIRTSTLDWLIGTKRLLKKIYLRLPKEYFNFNDIFIGHHSLIKLSSTGEVKKSQYNTTLIDVSTFSLNNNNIIFNNGSNIIKVD